MPRSALIKYCLTRSHEYSYDNHVKTIKRKSLTHGGTRPNAGRKVGTGLYGEATKTMRIPESALSTVQHILAACKANRLGKTISNDILFPAFDSSPRHAPVFSHTVAAGFPSPADDYIEGRLSLDEHLISNKETTFFVRAKGNSMIGAGIFDGDLLIVDKSLSPQSGNIVIAIVDGDLTVKRLVQNKGEIILKPENPRFKDIEFKDGQELQVWGVVTATIKRFG